MEESKAIHGQATGMGRIPFSRRTAWDLAESSLARALRQRRAAGLPITDLTASNPTQCGLEYDAADILGALYDPRVLEYDPVPRGLLTARQAVCAYYADRRAVVDPAQIFLTTSTSEAYSFLFRLLCDPGDEVLVAQPSYPLFDFLADLDDIRLVPYALIYDHGWQLDLNSLVARITSRTRAIALVHPNNPTGHFTKDWERQALASLCLERGLALIVDEVFLDYEHGSEHQPAARSFVTDAQPALTFVLSGLSKVAGLPQMKAAWIACLGPEQLRVEAENRLEIIADTFLSMNAPLQYALPAWLGARHGMQQQIQRRISVNLALLDNLLDDQRPISRLVVEGGWYAILRIPSLRADEQTSLRLIEVGVLVQPGYYFGFPPSGWLILSLLTQEREFRAGVDALLEVLLS